ncbi:hypothetical protein CS542_10810 [Pedobacter sp. IW39]|nr:hypothetical protein CS542_10810 [Pedobacter sp. IW39]
MLALGQVYSLKVFLAQKHPASNTVRLNVQNRLSKKPGQNRCLNNISRTDMERYPSLNRSLSIFPFTPNLLVYLFGGRNNRYK